MSLPGELDAITVVRAPRRRRSSPTSASRTPRASAAPDGVMHEKGAVYRALDASGIAIVNADDARVARAADAHARERPSSPSAARASADVSPRGRASLDGADAGSTRRRSRRPGARSTVAAPAPRRGRRASTSRRRSRRRRPRPACSLPRRGHRARARDRAPRRSRDADAPRRGHRRPRRHLQREPRRACASLSRPLAEIAGDRRQRRRPRRDEGARRRTPSPSTWPSATSSPASRRRPRDRLRRPHLAGRSSVPPSSASRCVMAALDRGGRPRGRSPASRPGDAVLVKGSRSVGAERVVAALIEAWPVAGNSATSGVRMIYELLYPLRHSASWLGWLNVLRYVPFRVIAATMTAMLHLLRALAVVHPRAAEEADRRRSSATTGDPRGHLKKRGTPDDGRRAAPPRGARLDDALVRPPQRRSSSRRPRSPRATASSATSTTT